MARKKAKHPKKLYRLLSQAKGLGAEYGHGHWFVSLKTAKQFREGFPDDGFDFSIATYELTDEKVLP